VGRGGGTRALPKPPIHPDTANLFAAVLSGDFTVNGFRNRDLQGKLYPAAMARTPSGGPITSHA
jgi:hypothetical protein